MSDQALYRVADQLYQNRTRIEDTLFDLDCMVTLYDLTNT